MSYFPNTGRVSIPNSSTSAIGANNTFSGTAEDVSQYSQINVFLDPDVSGVLNMQFSVDGSTWDRQKTIYIPATAGASPHTLSVVSKYFRVVYENGADAQTKFNLQTIYHHSKSKSLTVSPDEVISNQNDTELIRVFNSVDVDEARGAYSDRYTVHKFGENPAITTGAWEMIWENGGVFDWPVSASKIDVVSDNVTDTGTGVGARSVYLQGLDDNFDIISETIPISGTTVVTTANEYRRLFTAYVSSVGTYRGSNAGEISFDHTSGAAAALGVITPETDAGGTGLGRTRIGHYTIPRGYTGYVKQIQCFVDGSKTVDIRLFTAADADVVEAGGASPMRGANMRAEWPATNGFLSDYRSYLRVPERTDIWFEANAAATTLVSITFDLLVVRNTEGGLVEPQ